ncbi:MAG: VanZ family protein [Planctomycetota bacterium]
MSLFSLAKGSFIDEWLRMMRGAIRRVGGGAPHETLYHLLGFVVLGGLVGVALTKGGRLFRLRAWLLAWAGMVAFGGAIEGLQAFVPARTVSWFDFGGNALGGLLGLGALTGLAAALRPGLSEPGDADTVP